MEQTHLPLIGRIKHREALFPVQPASPSPGPEAPRCSRAAEGRLPGRAQSWSPPPPPPASLRSTSWVFWKYMRTKKGLCGFQSCDAVIYSKKYRIYSWSRAPQIFGISHEESDREVSGCVEVTCGKPRRHLRTGLLAWRASPVFSRARDSGLSPDATGAVT